MSKRCSRRDFLGSALVAGLVPFLPGAARASAPEHASSRSIVDQPRSSGLLVRMDFPAFASPPANDSA